MNLDICMEKIIKHFLDDTVETLEWVLQDDSDEPLYSAITTLNRLWLYMQYRQKTDDYFDCYDLESLLTRLGLWEESADILKKKALEGNEYYTGDILCEEFLKQIDNCL